MTTAAASASFSALPALQESPKVLNNFSRFTKLFWPTSDFDGRKAEHDLLSRHLHLEVNLEDSPKICPKHSEVVVTEPLTSLEKPKAALGLVPIDKDTFINTLCISNNPDSIVENPSFNVPSPKPDKRVLVWAHGYGAGLSFFYRNYALTADIPDLVAYSIDWLGMGRSSRVTFPKIHEEHGADPTAWEEKRVKEAEEFFVESLEKWRKKLNIEKMILAGHSLGGYLVCAYTEKYPERVEELILISPVGIPEYPKELDNENPSILLQSDDKAVGDSEVAKLPAPQTEFSKNKRVGPPPRLRSIIKQCWEWNWTPQMLVRTVGPLGFGLVGKYVENRMGHLSAEEQKDFHRYFYYITASPGSGEYALSHILQPGAFARKPLTHRIPKLDKRITFIYGEIDWMDYRHALVVQKHSKNPCEIFRIKNGGHHMYLENAEEFNDVMQKVLSNSTTLH